MPILKSKMTSTVNRVIVDSLVTETSEAQLETQRSCQELLKHTVSGTLLREKHVRYLRSMLETRLPGPFKSMDASRPWLVYWAANALALLGEDISDLNEAISSSILACQNSTGGLGGGNRQLSHLAPTYAGVSALALSGDKAAWKQIDRGKCYSWMMSLKQSDGSFRMCEGGESDPRATYCALAVASLLNILTPDLVAGSGQYISRCQTYEGGFANVPIGEAHGGYAFCALASLCFLGPPSEVIAKYIDVDRALKWFSCRQLDLEKGFSGRTNKLVDGCYSHWVGGCWAFLASALHPTPTEPVWDIQGLQRYVLVCCQDSRGGLRDKPGKHPDTYHSNYAICGLSAAQHRYTFENQSGELGDWAFLWKSQRSVERDANWVKPINPVHVLPEGVAETMRNFFVALENDE
jgi:protein farnesyltransferase subunit beta